LLKVHTHFIKQCESANMDEELEVLTAKHREDTKQCSTAEVASQVKTMEAI